MDQKYYIGKVNTLLTDMISGCIYLLLALIQFGGQGGVYQALEKKSKKVVALKLQTNISPNESRVLQLYIENQNSMMHNVKMLSQFEKESHKCIIMEYANGGNLYDYMKSNQLKQGEKIEIMKQLSLGVQELHKLKLIHRDIKPENVVIFNDDNGNRTYKLCDIGLVRIQSDDFDDKFQVGTGTEGYMAPEMFVTKDYNETIDIWALGVLFLEILSGQDFYQYNTSSIDQIIQQFSRDPNILVYKIRSFSLAEYETLIIKMLSVVPTQRPKIDVIVEHFQPTSTGIRIIQQPITQVQQQQIQLSEQQLRAYPLIRITPQIQPSNPHTQDHQVIQITPVQKNKRDDQHYSQQPQQRSVSPQQQIFPLRQHTQDEQIVQQNIESQERVKKLELEREMAEKKIKNKNSKLTDESNYNIRQAQSQIHILEQQLKETLNQLTNAQQEIQALGSLKDDYQNQVWQLEQEIANLKSDLSQQSETIKRLNLQINDQVQKSNMSSKTHSNQNVVQEVQLEEQYDYFISQDKGPKQALVQTDIVEDSTSCWREFWSWICCFSCCLGKR